MGVSLLRLDRDVIARTKNEVICALLTDAVAFAYSLPGLAADQAVTVDVLRERMDVAGMLEDCAED